MTRSILPSIAAALALWCALPAMAQTPYMPTFDTLGGAAVYCPFRDHAISAGVCTIAVPDTQGAAPAIASTDQAEICRVEMGIDPRDGHYGRLTYSVRNRMSEEQSGAIKRAWLPAGARLADFELDHIVSLALGGSNDKSNLQMQPIAEAKLKDKVEDFLWRSVCINHTMALTDAQEILRTDWRSAYDRYIRPDGGTSTGAR